MFDLKKLLRTVTFLSFYFFIANYSYSQTCGFTLQQDSGCIPLPILATATDTAATPPVVSRSWCLTTCSGATVFCPQPGPNPSFSFVPLQAGCYTLTMISTNQSGQTCTFAYPNILVSDTPIVINPQVGPSPFCAPQTVTLNMTASAGCGSIEETQIQWGCGNIDQCVGFCPTATHLYSGTCNPICYSVNVVLRNSCGCVGTKRITNGVCVLPKPIANFSVDVSSGVCVSNLTSNFTATNNGPGFTYSWFVNGQLEQSSSSINFTHLFPAALSCYQVKLVVANATGCSDSLVRDNFICVFAAPQLSFTIDTSSLCVDPGQTGLLCVKNTSTPFLPTPIWRISRANVTYAVDTGDQVCIPVNVPGFYQVTLIGSYGPGCTDSLVVPNAFDLKPNPVPCFWANDSFTCQQNLCTTFNNCSTAPPGSSYLWNFGAGSSPPSSSSMLPTPPICYNGLGKRDVSLSITSANGCFKMLKKLNYIVVDTVNPTILVNKSYGCAPLTVSPQSITNVPPGSPYYICNTEWWVYEHNTTNLVANRFGSAFFLTLNNPGCYDLKMQVTTCSTSGGIGAGCVSSTWDTSAICVGEPPVCTMTVGPDSMCFEADSVSFDFSGSGCNANRYIVHYGDEPDPNAVTYVTESPFVHIYQSFGEFDAWVIPVQDSCESDSIYRHHIVVFPPSANFTSATSCLSGDTVCFINGALGANRYKWQFGCIPDTFNAFSPCILLPYCDTCTVTLTVYNDSTNCKHSKTSFIETACSSITATFTPDTIIGCETVNSQLFTNTTPGASQGSTYWDWDATNGVNCQPFLCITGQTAVKSFYPGINRIAMVYTAPGGCTDTAFGYIQSCSMNADFGPKAVCLPDSFHFSPLPFDTTASGVGCDSLVSWKWTFDGNLSDTSNEQFPVHYFSLGNHTVKLKVTNIYGCVDSVTYPVTAGTPVYTYWSVDSNLCPGSTVCITNNTSSGVSLVEEWEFPGSNLPGGHIGHSPPCLTYDTIGDFPLVYSVSGGTCQKSDTITMRVHSPVLSGYLSDDFASCPPLAVCATNTSQWVDILTDVYTWDFGNFEYLEVNPCDFYSEAGVYNVILTVVTDNGCRDTAVIDTVVVDGPYGSIGHSPFGICSCKDSVDFEIRAIKATQLTFVWGCSQGFTIVDTIIPTGTDLNPAVFNYRIPYCVNGSCLPQVTFGDASGCNVLYNDSLVYVDSPVINIVFDNFGICLAGTANFFDGTTYTLPDSISHSVAWTWDFGDPNDLTPSNLQNPTHYYSQPGIYPVTLSVVSNFGCYDTLLDANVVVIPKYPIAGFYADDSLVCAESAICFHDTSYVDTVTGPQFWYWDFGDGTTDSVSGPDACHIYAAGGSYTVHLCLYDSIGCGDCDSSFVMNVISKPIANAGPDTVFCLGIQVQLNGSGSDTCHWLPANLVSDVNSCNPLTTIFQDEVFVLTVVDKYGCSGVDTLQADVASVTANFNVTTSACLNDSVCVTDASIALNGTLVSWQYNFGEVNTVSGSDVCYKYAAPNTYSIIETVTDNHGCIDTAERSINIFPQPMAAFSANDTVICSDLAVCFIDLSTSVTTISDWVWNFGSGQGGYVGPNPPCHLFIPPFQANYTVSLVVTDLNQCKDTALLVVTVNEIPQANFTWSTSCEDAPMPLSNSSVDGDGGIDSCTWTLWLGATTPLVDYNCNTSFQFPPGLHDVQLVVHDLNGCIDTVVKTVQTDSLSQLTIYPGDTTLCVGDSASYTVNGVFDNIVWTPTTWVSDPFSPVVTITPLGNVGYIITAANGVCEPASDTFGIQVIQKIPIDVIATPENIVLGLSSNIASQIPAPIDSIVWTPDSTLDCSNCVNPVATPKQTTTYCATIYYGRNGVTCTNLACVTITVLNSCSESIVYLPNTFTPNGDGINDIFMIRGIAATRINHFRVFDRWGKVVYEITNGEANQTAWGWDGTDRNGEKLNPAVFVYTYEIECINNDIVTGSGNITLVR